MPNSEAWMQFMYVAFSSTKKKHSTRKSPKFVTLVLKSKTYISNLDLYATVNLNSERSTPQIRYRALHSYRQPTTSNLFSISF